MGAALVALLMTFATGWVLVSWVWPGAADSRLGFILRAAVAAGIGLSVSSVVYLACLALGIAQRPWLFSFDLAVLVVLAVLSLLARQRRNAIAKVVTKDPDPARSARAGAVDFVLGAGLFVALGVHARVWLVRTADQPLGFWDAFAIWNLKARFFFLESGEHWRRAFSETIAWSHTDYPLLLPLNVARLWTYADRADPRFPELLSVLFALLVMLSLFGAVASMQGRAFAFLAVFAALATPVLVGQATWQIADIPLSYFLLSSGALVVASLRQDESSSRLLLLAGMLAGAAAWTKNEGLLIALAIPIALVLCGAGAGFRERVRRVLHFATGFAPALALVLVFKFAVGGTNDIASDFEVASLARTFELARHHEIVSSFARTLLGLTSWPLLGLLAGLSAWLAFASRRGDLGTIAPVAVALALQLAGYYFIYLITERDLSWHLATSNLRLFTQLWPSVLLLLFLCLPPLEQTNAPPQSSVRVLRESPP